MAKKMTKPKAKLVKSKKKIKRVMKEFESGELHSGSKNGPIVTNPKQGIAIALEESRKETGLPKKKKRKK